VQLMRHIAERTVVIEVAKFYKLQIR
jgi:hypothetical protein